MFFKVKPATVMSKIFDAYAKRRGGNLIIFLYTKLFFKLLYIKKNIFIVNTKALRFLLDGKRVEPNDTPKLVSVYILKSLYIIYIYIIFHF